MLRLIDGALLLVFARLSDLTDRDEGQTLAEYGLIITVIAVAIVVTAMLVFRETLIEAYNSASTCLDGICT